MSGLVTHGRQDVAIHTPDLGAKRADQRIQAHQRRL